MTQQLLWLFMLALPVACVTWTITHEDLFREVREWLEARAHSARPLYQRKIYYLFTCEYCFSHYVALTIVVITDFHLLLNDWRGYLIAWFSVVWIANVYMSLYGHLRLDIKRERGEIDAQTDSKSRKSSKSE